MICRRLNPKEIRQALELVWDVFLEYEACDYTEEGVHEFRKSIDDPDYLKALVFYGAFDRQHLLGVIASRSEGTHIALFFVRGNYHGKGIGRMLFNRLMEDTQHACISVNASPFAVSIYHHFGFSEIDAEQCVHGLRFTPMTYIREMK